jgi:acylglycerol lipase
MKNPLIFCPVVLLLFINLTRINAQELGLIAGQSKLTKQINAKYSALCFNSLGDDIYYRKWGESQIQGTPKVLLIIHGLGNHSYPFMKIMNFTDHDNILVYAMDLRGHGLSGKTKGVLESNEKVLTDMDNMLDIIKEENPDSQIYLLGISMGGLYSLGYLLSNKISYELSGLILVGPALMVHRSQIFQFSNLKFLWLLIFNKSRPGINIDGKKLGMSSRDHDWIETRRNDSLAIPVVSVDYLRKVHQMQRMDKQKTRLSSISLPVLIQHGGKDKIADLKGAYYLKKNLTNARVELMVYPESYHTLFWDNDSTRILNDIVNWIVKN